MMRIDGLFRPAPVARGPVGGGDIDRFLAAAMRFQGQPYRWGGGHGDGTFRAPGPVDCSGLVTQAARMAGINLEGTAAELQRASTPIAKADLRPGDLVFKGSPAHHVGIYMGNGQVLNAPKTGDSVRMTSVDNFDRAARPNVFRNQAPAADNNIPGKPDPQDDARFGGNQGRPSLLDLPRPEPVGGIPTYRAAFGGADHVTDPGDPSLVALVREAIAKDLALANTTMGQHAQEGHVDAADVAELQLQLQARGFSVGPAGVDGLYGPQTHGALSAFLANNPGPDAGPWGPLPGGVPGLGQTKDGHQIPRGEGRATTFANGHIAYKNWTDGGNRQNGGLGAWGDRCAPTEYFCALPVGLQGGGNWWHNQKILVTDPASGKQVVVRVQDKGPHPKTGNAIDLSPVAMEALGGKFNGSLGNVKFQFAPDDAPVGPVR